MKKESKEMLKTIIRNQELIMKALKITVPVKEVQKSHQGVTKKVASASPASKSKAPVKKVAAKKTVVTKRK